jgi:hypothetical protein
MLNTRRTKKITALQGDTSTSKSSRGKHAFALISGVLSLVADIVTLLSFIRGFYTLEHRGSLSHPMLWLAVQLAVTVYGNLALGYVYVIAIIKIRSRTAIRPKPSDMWNTLRLFVSITWIPTFLVWVVTCLILAFRGISAAIAAAPNVTPDIVLVYVFSGMAILGAGVPLAILIPGPIGRAAALISRTLRPDLQIKVVPTGDSWWN